MTKTEFYPTSSFALSTQSGRRNLINEGEIRIGYALQRLNNKMDKLEKYGKPSNNASILGKTQVEKNHSQTPQGNDQRTIPRVANLKTFQIPRRPSLG